ncbi:hypothetical protein TIFTF001_033060 [Ficus carica]|uniref:AAA+ ATPase domain-containing protein n=1 Tax=Ficus carica TaxID=3494 RepID=A0AA88DYB2_FICCA|nr:hypothetical protein TIFTF001_033060 [Ficus carica]
MAEIASLVRDCVEWMWNPISQRLSYFKNYHKNVEALADKARTLEARRNDVGKSVDAAKSQDQEIRKEVQRWQERDDKLLKDLVAFEDRIKENKSCISGCVPYCRWRYRLSKQAKEIASDVDALLLPEQRYDHVSLPRAQRPPEFKRTESMRKFQLFSSTEIAMNKVMEGLRSDSFRVIGVHGMGGVGKTTMVKQVAEKAVTEGLFNVVVMVTISQAVNLRRIQSQIAEGLGLKSLGADSTVEGRATKVRDRIVREKKVLIILDDLWKKLDLNRVGIPYGCELENCESKILITTRLQQVCTQMDSHRIKLQHLSEPDSWEFFKKTAGTNFDSQEFEAIGKSVAKECGGLPIALVAVAKALADKDMEEPTYQSYTAISLMCNEINRLPDGLDCPKLKTLMLQDNSSLKEIPAAFFKMMNALMILDLNGIHASSLPSSIESLKDLRTLHLDGCKFKDIAILGVLEKLEILSLRESLVEALPEDMAKLSNLRMLDLTSSYNIEKIPSKLISNLSYLEELYLNGSFAHWEDAMELRTSLSTDQGRNAFFDELVNLPCLTILKVDIEDVKCLPSNVETVPNWVKFDICVCRRQFTRMMNVHSKNMSVYSRHLLLDIQMKNLPDWFIEVVAKKAEKLIYSDCWDLNLLEEYEHGQLAGLKSLDVEQCQEVRNLMRVTNNSGPGSAPVFESLQELRIFHMDFLEQMCVGELPTGSLEKLKSLAVQQCNNLVNSLLPSNLIKRLGNLEKLLVNGSSVEEVFGFEGLEQGQVYLGRLQEIRLENLSEIANICRGPTCFADFRNIKFVTVIRCMKLRNLFPVSISDSLMQLEDLWVEECVLMEEVIRDEHAISQQKVKLPRLKTLSLKNLPKLSSFYAGNASLECPSLEHLHVHECQNFRTNTSDFHSSKQVHENDEQHMKLLQKRFVQ